MKDFIPENVFSFTINSHSKEVTNYLKLLIDHLLNHK